MPEGLAAPPELVANALPQALILTAIVIGFGLLAFALALVFRSYQVTGTLDTDAPREARPGADTPAEAAPQSEAAKP